MNLAENRDRKMAPLFRKKEIPMAIVSLEPEEKEEPQITEQASENSEFLPMQKERKKISHSYKKARPLRKRSKSSASSFFEIKGISYNAPIKVYIGAIASMMFITTLILALFIPVYIFLIGKLDLIAIIILASFLISAILYFTVSLQCRCRVCRAPLFSLRHFMRNKQAHHLPILGYTFATALHVVLFFWFRCQACGTSQKLINTRN